MDIRVEAQTFREALSKVYRVVSTRPVTPALGGILVDSSGDKVCLSATDLEVGITATFRGEILEEGQAVLPGKVLYNIVRTLKGEVRLRTEGERALLQCGRSRFELSGFPPGDFPFFPQGEESFVVLLPGELFKEALLRTYFAVSRDETRPVLTGVLLAFAPGRFEVVATDGHRLSRNVFELSGIEKEARYVLPQKAVVELLRLLGREDARFVPQDGSVVFRIGETMLFSTLIEGEYPNYLQVIPQSFVSRAQVSREELLEALERVALVTSGVPVVEVSFGGGVLQLRVTGDLGVAEEEVTGETEGDHLKVAFNVRYLLEALRVMKDERVELGLSGELSPAKVSSSSSFEYVLMPVRLQGV
ncbi:DNA polymerase III subunit beta [Candidatus Caldatribacterium sp. SIUC1]|uniref:DNA polymerase III subunit beta n=1 Tax=Candidatus Caldatribacterium sp. SIUC1 TaxID=3418365 RepID=UPI003F68FF9B